MKHRVLAAIPVALLALVSWQNLAFNNTFSDLVFREIDDVAFQASLNKFHKAIANIDFVTLLSANDYAYGWVYWIPLSILSFPLYVLHTFTGIDWPLITFPRMISTFALAAAAFAVYKLGIQKKASRASATVLSLAVLVLSPNLYLSMRFGTVMPILAATVLSAYFALREKGTTRANLISSFIFMALAGGIKASGLLAVPLIVAIWFWRYYKRIALKNLLTYASVGTVAVFVSSLALNFPPIIISPIFPWVGDHYFDNLKQFSLSSAKASPVLDSAQSMFGVLTQSLGIPLAILFLILLVLGLSNSKTRALTLTALGIFAAEFVLVNSMISNEQSRVSYLTAVTCATLILLLFTNESRRATALSNSLILLGAVTLAIPVIQQANGSSNSWNAAYYTIQNDGQAREKLRASNISKALNYVQPQTWNKTLVLDYTIKTNLSQITSPDSCTTWVFENLNSRNSSCEKSPDFIVLDSKKKIENINSQDGQGNPVDKAVRELLYLTGQFGNSKFEKKHHIDGADIFVRVN